MNVNDLPSVVLVEILCRLPCYKLVFQSKCVSKRWNVLISDPYFIGRFLHHLRTTEVEAPLLIRTLINHAGGELSWSPSRKSLNLLAPLLRKLMSSQGLKDEPIVKATYNDLVLCCEVEMEFYYICNPYTLEFVAIPPSPSSFTWPVRKAPVAIICDYNYYDYTKEGASHSTILLNADYRCRVVRMLPFFDKADPHQSSKFTVEIFSSETGEWKESIFTSPIPFHFSSNDICFAYDGTLCWWDFFTNRHVGMDPFMIDSNSNADQYKFRFMGFDGEVLDHRDTINRFGVCRGGLRMGYYDEEEDILCVWDWKEDPDQNRASDMLWKQTGVFSPGLSPESVLELLAFDPNNDDILYLLDVADDICVCNIRTGELSVLVGVDCANVFYSFPLVLPWWPTPVPKIPKPSWLSRLMKKLRLIAFCIVSVCSE